jgi:hypothetical protein
MTGRDDLDPTGERMAELAGPDRRTRTAGRYGRQRVAAPVGRRVSVSLLEQEGGTHARLESQL